MKPRLSRCRNNGSIALGIFVIVIVTIFLLGVWTIGSRASRIKPRRIDYDLTNSFWTIDRRDTVYLTPPGQSDPPPGIYRSRLVSEPSWFMFTNELAFVDSESFSNSWLTVERTSDHVSWTVLTWIMFEEPRYTNGMVYQVFVDMYAPISSMNFYRGIIHTNGW